MTSGAVFASILGEKLGAMRCSDVTRGLSLRYPAGSGKVRDSPLGKICLNRNVLSFLQGFVFLFVFEL